MAWRAGLLVAAPRLIREGYHVSRADLVFFSFHFSVAPIIACKPAGGEWPVAPQAIRLESGPCFTGHWVT